MRYKINLGNNTLTFICKPTVGWMTWYKSVYFDFYSGLDNQRTFRFVAWRWFHFDIVWNEVEPYW